MKQFKMALMAILTIFCITTVNAQTKKDSTAKQKIVRIAIKAILNCFIVLIFGLINIYWFR